ncbi:unnamed protein product, partial [Urochloa humidicola]
FLRLRGAPRTIRAEEPQPATGRSCRAALQLHRATCSPVLLAYAFDACLLRFNTHPSRRAEGHARSPPDLRPPARAGRVGLGLRGSDGARLSFARAGMRSRWAGVLLLVAVFAVVAVAKDSADTLPVETNGDGSKAQSGVENLEHHDETNPNKEHVTQEKGLVKNDTSEDNKKDNSTEGTNIGTDDSIQQPKDKDGSTTKFSKAKDFWQDPLIMECDTSHRCIIENKKFIACLKVPGEDSLALSLLMDNKGMDPLDVSITAPDYVTLAVDTVHVESSGHNEVSVSISDGEAANNTAIVLKVAGGSCTVNIHNAITRETGRVIRMPLTSTYTLVPVFLLLAVVGVCIILRRMRKQDGGPAYQKPDAAELPVSVGGKKETNQSDKWDDNWGDDWDDEEAPMTPSKPMPNLSSKGLAPRRSMKDGWKD